jgi:hypothetical protein
MRYLLIFGFSILELDVEPICISRRKGESDPPTIGWAARGSSDDVELALKLSKYLIAKSIKGKRRFSCGANSA